MKLVLPEGWTADRGSSWSVRRHLVHRCGFRTRAAYDLWSNGLFGEAEARRVMYGHRCNGGCGQ